MANEQNLNALSLLDTIQPKGEIQQDVENVNNYVPAGLTPDQLSAYQSQYMTQGTGALPVSSYYPDAGHNVGVGSFSTSGDGLSINSTLFAPGGGLVPLGMLDARDLAVKHAAMQKQKGIEDFYKRYQQPTTKQVAVEQNLTNSFQNFIQGAYKSMLKKTGNNSALAYYALKMDPQFNATYQAYIDHAKFGDAIVEHAAQLNADKKAGRVVSKETDDLTNNLLGGMAYRDIDPFSPEGHNIGAKYLAANSSYSLDKIGNEAIAHTKPTIEPQPIDKNEQTKVGVNIIQPVREKTYYTDETKHQIAENMVGASGGTYNYETAKKWVDANLASQEKRNEHVIRPWDKPEKVEPDYSNVTETTANININTADGTKQMAVQGYIPLNATHEKQEISFPINKETLNMSGENFIGKTGSFKATTSGFGISYINTLTGKPSTLTPEEIQSQIANGTLDKNIEAKPIAVVNRKTTVAPLPSAQLKQLQEPLQIEDGEGGKREETPEEIQERVNTRIAEYNKEQETKKEDVVGVPISHVKGKFVKKNGQKVGADEKITEKEQQAEAINHAIQNQKASAKKVVKSGDAVDGYIFKGGDPKDPKNWKKQ